MDATHYALLAWRRTWQAWHALIRLDMVAARVNVAWAWREIGTAVRLWRAQ
jgi:hypothetical protein